MLQPSPRLCDPHRSAKPKEMLSYSSNVKTAMEIEQGENAMMCANRCLTKLHVGDLEGL